MYNFCTYFDRNYLPQALALYESLNNVCSDFTLYALCLDEDSFKILKEINFEKLRLISLDEMEKFDANLLKAKTNRSNVEYYFTLSPALPLYVFKQYEVDFLTYLDADLFFFSDPRTIITEMTGYSIGIINHRLYKRFSEMFIYGRFNVGWISFRRDKEGMDCLQSWYQQCIDWCYKRLEDGKYADQKYLDEWPVRYGGLKIIENLGANVAPWNVENYHIKMNNSEIMVDNDTLVFFHFHGLKKYNKNIYSIGYKAIHINETVRSKIYFPYVITINENIVMLNNLILEKKIKMDFFEKKSVFWNQNLYNVAAQYLSLLFRLFISGNYVRIKNSMPDDDKKK